MTAQASGRMGLRPVPLWMASDELVFYAMEDRRGGAMLCAVASDMTAQLRSTLWNQERPAILTSGTLAVGRHGSIGREQHQGMAPAGVQQGGNLRRKLIKIAAVRLFGRVERQTNLSTRRDPSSCFLGSSSLRPGTSTSSKSSSTVCSPLQLAVRAGGAANRAGSWLCSRRARRRQTP